MRAVLLLAAAAAAERTSWFGSSQKKEKPVTREGRAVQLARKVLEARSLEDAHSLARAGGPAPPNTIHVTAREQTLLQPIIKSRRDARGCQRVVASASARPLTKTALERGGFLCRALLVLEAAHHRGPASSKRDAHLGAIDAACAFNAKTWRPPAADQHARKIVVAIHHNGLGNQLFQWAFGKLVALDAGAAFAARKMRRVRTRGRRWRPQSSSKGARPHSSRGLESLHGRVWEGVARLPSGRRREMCAVDTCGIAI